MSDIDLLKQEIKDLKIARGQDQAYISELEDRVRDDLPYSDAWVYQRTIEGLRHDLTRLRNILEQYKSIINNLKSK